MSICSCPTEPTAIPLTAALLQTLWAFARGTPIGASWLMSKLRYDLDLLVVVVPSVSLDGPAFLHFKSMVCGNAILQASQWFCRLNILANSGGR